MHIGSLLVHRIKINSFIKFNLIKNASLLKTNCYFNQSY